ncbi:site-specific integrase [Viridibacillus arvi]|uniref:site-specific integrase n=1 Tax=Viridibacillus arvi TaxID=263475 RepID=UPI003D0581B9
MFTPLKTDNSKRKIPISQMIVDELLKHLECQQVWKTRFGEEYQNQDFVICTENGMEQDPRNVLRAMKKIIRTSNVKQIHFHDIRHTHASILISEGVDIVKVAHRMGHANPRILMDLAG